MYDGWMNGFVVQVFSCFVALMQRLGKNFDSKGSGMHENLDNCRVLIQTLMPEFYETLCHFDLVNMFFCYRWLLLDFKREFSMKDVR